MATADRRRRQPADEMRSHYNLSTLRGAVRGKYAARYASGPHVVRLAPDVAQAFASDTEVNSILRHVLCEAGHRPSTAMSEDQLLEALLDHRVVAIMDVLKQAGEPLTASQIRRKLHGMGPITALVLLNRCEADGCLCRVRLRGVDRWSPVK